ncbi:hypothetical protein V6N12_065166 [Hibiscus sabdariffa]|uniref:Uncharacterized protein n=1 Tax=Hibiscus sabdariffa TaxID=183260 RepID=A0ABR2G7W5_9ROSI
MPLYCISTVHLPTSNGTDVVLIVIQKRVRDFGLSSIGLHRSDIEVSVSDERRSLGMLVLEIVFWATLAADKRWLTPINDDRHIEEMPEFEFAVDSLLALSLDIAAVGRLTFRGCRSSTSMKGEFLFTSFEPSMRNSNSILVYDLNTLNPVIEIDHNEIFGADLDSTIPATKLQWVSSYG